ncbi:ATP phosphoribosyltransferase regulatory subunit [Geopsychrobacter electrodiphilus]|uniref:ATP phosphoribosyltransferase regulatory subunit n=1 Tax=Geopsychrobacter electrodiphilus TaxID=225196 RepID=UPI0003766A16|nr:ATP phosphoribosyltransferase regulatory subunit [Geopsychrobacter electrodiphilus]
MTNIDAMPESALPKGVRDFLPLKAAKVEYLQQQLRQVMADWGFHPVIPPQLEFFDLLEKGLGNDLQARAFRFDDRQSGRLLAFPPDITPQIARIAATRMRDLPLPLRLCYSGKVLRHTEQQAGKDREIFQAGVELIGLAQAEADAEMIAMAIECLQRSGASDFTLDIGQVEFFRGVMDGLALPGDLARRVTGAIGRKDSTELKALLDEGDIDESAREEVLALTRLFGGREVLARAAKLVKNPRSQQALNTLEEVLALLDQYGLAEYVTFDLGELRGLDYHTGITFQGFLQGYGQAVCSGGRYDGLMANYGSPAPATGFTFDLLNLLFALDPILDAQVAPHTDLLVYARDGAMAQAQKLTYQLRAAGFSAARDMIERSRDEALAYAQLMNYRQLLVLTAAGGLSLVDPVTRREEALTLEELLKRKTL